ncbi:MAG: hypothetical protein PVJ27_00310 [Candidatus Brocadiaceae bacterium]
MLGGVLSALVVVHAQRGDLCRGSFRICPGCVAGAPFFAVLCDLCPLRVRCTFAFGRVGAMF